MFAVLVPIDIATPFGGLCQVIYVFFLLQTELLPARDGVSDNFEICKLVQKVAEILYLVIILLAGKQSKRTESYHR